MGEGTWCHSAQLFASASFSYATLLIIALPRAMFLVLVLHQVDLESSSVGGSVLWLGRVRFPFY